jgi:diketogulonate reductase-like aldo/keto reductase
VRYDLVISNCYDPQQFELLFRNAHIKLAVIQNRFYAETQYDRIIRDFCRQQGINYQNFWTLTANPKVLAHTTLQSLVAKYQRIIFPLTDRPFPPRKADYRV